MQATRTKTKRSQYVRIAQLTAPKTFRFTQTEEPTLKNQAEPSVVVRVNRACICGSDTPYYLGTAPNLTFPADLGLSIHECIGTVEESTSKRFKPGDKVLALPPHHRGLAEKFIATEDRTVPLPDGFSSEILMAQPLGTVVWACRKLPNILNLDAVVLGQGPMGLLINAALSNLGAKNVVGIDLIPERLALSKRMMATSVVNSSNENPVEQVKQITDGRMADLVVEAVGHQTDTMLECVRLLKRGGTLLAFGVPDDDIYPMPFREMYSKNITLIHSVGPEVQPDFSLAMDFIHQGRIDVSPILTHDFPFTEEGVQTAFDLFAERRDGAVKVIIHYEDGAFS